MAPFCVLESWKGQNGFQVELSRSVGVGCFSSLGCVCRLGFGPKGGMPVLFQLRAGGRGRGACEAVVVVFVCEMFLIGVAGCSFGGWVD